MRLFHNEDECYIVAEGSFASTNRIVEDGMLLFNYTVWMSEWINRWNDGMNGWMELWD